MGDGAQQKVGRAECVPNACLEGFEISLVRLRSVSMPTFAITRHTGSLDVAQVRRHRVRTSLLQDDIARLDDDAPSVRAQSSAGHAGSHTPTTEG